MKSLERRLHRIDNRIAEREVIFLRSTEGIFLAGIADADGGMVLSVMKGDLLCNQHAVSIPIKRERVRSLYRLMKYEISPLQKLPFRKLL